MPKSVKTRSKSKSKSKNRRGNYPQNGVKPLTHPYKLWVNNNAFPEAKVELRRRPMEAKATYIPSVGIDKITLQRKGREILTEQGWPVDLKSFSTVYILFENSSYALPYIYKEDVGYYHDPNINYALNSNAKKNNIYFVSPTRPQFSNIRVYSMEPSRSRSSSRGRNTSHGRNYTSRNSRRYTE